jgi:transcriptional regulator GlxA family with amidase domain
VRPPAGRPTRPTAPGNLAADIVLLLVPGFSMLSVVTVLEAMRIANRLSGTPIFSWQLQSEDGAPVRSSLDLTLPVDGPFALTHRDAYILVCGGADIHANVNPKVLAWIRRCSSHGARIGGLCTGTYALGRAGILRDARVTIHWEQRESFQEAFPDIALSSAPFEIDGPVLTSAGGTAGIDLILAFLRRAGLARLAEQVAAQLMYVNIHHLQADADIGLLSRLPVRNRVVSVVIADMEDRIEHVRPIAHFAELAGVSTRQLERLFRKHLGMTPGKYYMNLRLDRAHRLLVQTDMSLTDIAFATGFSASSGLGRKFKVQFGRPLSSFRR